MITRLEIKGFKSLVDVKLDLGAVNIFIGANGSGKSNLLEAIGFLGALSYGSGEFEGYRYRGVRPGDPDSFVCQISNNPNPAFAMCIADADTIYRFSLSPAAQQGWENQAESILFEHDIIVQRQGKYTNIVVKGHDMNLPSTTEMLPLASLQFVPLYFAFNRDLYQADRSSPDIPFLNASFFSDIRHLAIYTPTTASLRGWETDIHRDPLGLGGSGLAKAIEEMMNADPEKLGPFYLDDIMELIEWADAIGTNSVDRPAGTPIRLRLGDRFMKDDRNAVSAVEASEGALYVLFLLTLASHEKSPKMFAVDNFDQTLHPRLAQKLTRMVCDQIVADGTRQMLATTHNPLVLNGLNLRDDRIRLFTVDRDAAGATVVKRVEVSDELMAKAEKGFASSEMWTMGWLGGGVPKNF